MRWAECACAEAVRVTHQCSTGRELLSEPLLETSEGFKMHLVSVANKLCVYVIAVKKKLVRAHLHLCINIFVEHRSLFSYIHVQIKSHIKNIMMLIEIDRQIVCFLSLIHHLSQSHNLLNRVLIGIYSNIHLLHSIENIVIKLLDILV